VYTDPEEARSDLFLAGAVYLFGPLLLSFVAPLLGRVPVVGLVFVVVSPLLTTVLVPVLMIRYRKEPWAAYGAISDSNGVRLGLLAGLPIAAAAVLGVVVRAALGGPDAARSVVVGAAVLAPSSVTAVELFANISQWAGLIGLALYATVKARDAFRADLLSVRDGVVLLGRWLAIAAGASTVLLVVAVSFGVAAVGLVVVPLGVAAGVYLLFRGLRRTTTTRATLLAPVVLLALGPFQLFALLTDATGFLFGVWGAAILGAVGLIVAVLLETRRSAVGAVALLALLALLVPAQPGALLA